MDYARVDTRAEITDHVTIRPQAPTGTPLVFAAHPVGNGGRLRVAGHYNGKIERPRLVGRAVTRLEMEQLRGEEIPAGLRPVVLGAWDFSKEMMTETIIELASPSSPWHDCQPTGPSHEGIQLDRRGNVLAPQTRTVRGDLFP